MMNVIIVSRLLRTPKKLSLADPKVAGAPEAALPVGKPLSHAVRESLRATAQSVNDPDLRAQLLKLASLP